MWSLHVNIRYMKVMPVTDGNIQSRLNSPHQASSQELVQGF